MSNCSFKWKYPLWYSENIKISDSQFFEMGRSGIWYTKNIAIKEAIYQCAPYIGFPKVIDALSVVNEVFE